MELGFLGCVLRQVNEGVRKNMEEFSNPSPKHTSGDDYRKNADFDIPTSPPLNLNETSLANWSPHGHAHPHGNSSPGQLKGRGLDELGGRGGADKASSVEVRLVSVNDIKEVIGLSLNVLCLNIFIF